jgi:Ice-binding-like/Secretion system C-terminal sorting domain
MKTKLLLALTAGILFLMPGENFGQAPPLGTTSKFALFTAVGAFNNTGESIVTGDVGTNVGAFNAFPPGILVGQKHVADPASAQAASDVDVAYSNLSAVTCGSVIATTLGNGQTLTPGVYCLGAASTINGNLILDGQGDPSKIFIFKIDGALSTTTWSNVVLTNSASLCNVYWQINGQVQLGENSVFRGTIVANGAIILLEASSLFGRGLTRQGAISLHNNVVTLEAGSATPTIVANGPTTFCAGGSVILSGNIGGTWSNGATTASITVKQSGDYFISRTNACGLRDTSNHIMVVVGSLSCTLTGNSSLCLGESIELCAPPSDSSTYLWSNGATTRCITVSVGGKYSVTVTTEDGCKSTCSKTVAVTTAPSCSITGKDTICEGSATTLCATYGKDYTYLWSNGATSRCISVKAAGTFSVTITKDEHHSSICTKTVSVTAAAVCLIEGSSTILKGGSTQLCAPFSASSSYLWSNGATTNCITASAEGIYSVTVTNADGCTKTCNKTIKITDAPSCTIEGNASLCLGQSTQLCAPIGSGYTYLWSTGSTSRCIMVNTASNYSLTVYKNGNATTCTKTVTISSVPCCPITGSNTLCEGGSTSLCGPTGTGYTYLWNTGATSRCITISAGGTYSLKLTKNGSTTTCSKTVLVAALACGISGNSTICTGGSTSLCAPYGNGSTYLWSTGETTRCISVNAAGTSTVTVTKDGCSSTCSRTVNLSTPSSTIAGNSNICEGNTTALCGPNGYGYSYLWSTGATSRCLTASATGTFSLTVTAFGCSTTSTKTVTVNPTPVCSISGNLYPTAGTTTTLCAPAGLSSYKWNTGATTQCISVDCTATYTVVAESFGCISSCSASVMYPASTANASSRTSSPGRASVGGKVDQDELHLNAYPNPFYSTAIIEFQNPVADTHVMVELYSTSGLKVGTLFDREVEPGGFTKVEVNAGELPSGIYIYRITNGYKIINRKIILRR